MCTGELTKDGRGKSIWDSFITSTNINTSDSSTNGEVADLSYDFFIEGKLYTNKFIFILFI